MNIQGIELDFLWYLRREIRTGRTRNNTEMAFLGEQVQSPVITSNLIINSTTKSWLLLTAIQTFVPITPAGTGGVEHPTPLPANCSKYQHSSTSDQSHSSEKHLKISWLEKNSSSKPHYHCPLPAAWCQAQAQAQPSHQLPTPVWMWSSHLLWQLQAFLSETVYIILTAYFWLAATPLCLCQHHALAETYSAVLYLCFHSLHFQSGSRGAQHSNDSSQDINHWPAVP